jgi:hypothetical protein
MLYLLINQLLVVGTGLTRSSKACMKVRHSLTFELDCTTITISQSPIMYVITLHRPAFPTYNCLTSLSSLPDLSQTFDHAWAYLIYLVDS